jgi:biopolymer transport protein ExbB
MNIDSVFRNLVGLGATWILWFLVLLSSLALAVIIERLVFFVRTRERTQSLGTDLRLGISRKELGPVRKKLEGSPSLEARIVYAGFRASCPEEAEELMAAEAQLQRIRSEKNLAFLGTLGNNAPFVGLLGTVIGIIGAFEQLEVSGGQLTTGLMAEIGEALIATAVGILVALPAVAAYNAFQRAIQVRLNSGDALGRQLIAFLHARERDRGEASVTLRAVGGE